MAALATARRCLFQKSVLDAPAKKKRGAMLGAANVFANGRCRGTGLRESATTGMAALYHQHGNTRQSDPSKSFDKSHRKAPSKE
jgi:hypothetical protein